MSLFFLTIELKNIDTSLDNKDVDAVKKSLEKVDTLTVDNTLVHMIKLHEIRMYLDHLH